MARKNEGDVAKVMYDERIFHLGIEFYEKSEIAIDILYHLLKSKKIRAFTAIMLRSQAPDFGDFLAHHKRKTDLLFSIDESEKVYVVLCQETKVDGGVYFMKRLEREMQALDEKETIYASVLAVESSRYDIRDLLFLILDNYIKALEEKSGPIVYRTVR